MNPHPFNFWSPRGTVGRGQYLLTGAILFALKHNLDRIVASVWFNRRWSLFNYWAFGAAESVQDTSLDYRRFYATLIAIAIPFIWVGVVLTLRRLRSIGLPLWLVAVFFLPFINLLFFVLLSILPAREAMTDDVRGHAGADMKHWLGPFIPRSAFGSAALGIVLTAALSVGITVWSVNGLGNYGWGLFVGLPFCLGLTSVLVYGYHEPRTLGSCLVVALLSVALVSAALFAVAVEGLICLIMAAPLGIALALFGGFMGYIIQRREGRRFEPPPQVYTTHAFAFVLLALPAMMLLESSLRFEPPLRGVRTAVEIDAPPERVWENVVSFAELPTPTERLFQTGIAYPLRAEIEGRGVGAVRHCVFSTGAFVEPIEVWDEPRLLRFGVTAQPPIMDEMSPYPHLSPPHLNNYLHSRRGQFTLTPLAGGRTRLEGTTWYQSSFWPGVYWNRWSDYIIHRIHGRVLDHIKNLSEKRRP